MAELPDRRVLEEAAEWFALLNSNHVSDADRLRWQVWLGKPGSAQGQAWQRVQALSDQFGLAREPAAHTALRTALGRRRQVLRSLLLVSGVGLGAWGAVNSRMWHGWTADYRSRVGEVRQIALPDGTQLWLNTDSAISLRDTAQRREVHLLHGEVYVVTAKPAVGENRPFVVTTDDGSARALGTRYGVRVLEGRTDVSVYEGAVALQPRTASREVLVVQAGERAVLTPALAASAGRAGDARRDWTRGLLLAEDVSLGQFLDELSAYRQGYLGYAPEVAQLRLVGAFPIHDTDAALDMITRSLPVVVRRRSRWWVTVMPRESAQEDR